VTGDISQYWYDPGSLLPPRKLNVLSFSLDLAAKTWSGFVRYSFQRFCLCLENLKEKVSTPTNRLEQSRKLPMSLSAAPPCAAQDVEGTPLSLPFTPNLDSSVPMSGCAKVAAVLDSAEEDRERCLAIAKAVADLYEVNGSTVRNSHAVLNAVCDNRLWRRVCTSLKSER
jgi:hypothetical protein